MAMDTREKFTKWSDKTTGINPFLSPQRAPRAGLAVRAARAAVRAVLFCIKVPLLAGLLLGVAALQLMVTPPLLLVIAAGLNAAPEEFLPQLPRAEVATGFAAYGLLLCAPLGFLMPLKKFPAQVVRGVLLRAVFIVLGINYAEEHGKLRQLGLPLPKDRSSLKRLGRPGAGVKAGDIILSNHTCVLDVLYLARRFGPAFATIRAGADGAFYVKPPKTFLGLGCNIFPAAFNALFFPEPATSEVGLRGLEEVAAWAKSSGVPVVLFPECAKENATGVLQWADVASRAGSGDPNTPALRVHLFAFGFEQNIGCSFAHPSGSPLGYLFWLCSRITGTAKVTVLDAQHTPAFPTAPAPGVRTRAPKPSAWLEECRGLVAKMLGAKVVNLSAADGSSFRAYLYALARGDSEAAKAMADKRKKV